MDQKVCGHGRYWLIERPHYEISAQSSLSDTVKVPQKNTQCMYTRLTTTQSDNFFQSFVAVCENYEQPGHPPVNLDFFYKHSSLFIASRLFTMCVKYIIFIYVN